MDEAWGQYAKWNKLVTKSTTLHGSTYRRHVIKIIETENRMVATRACGEVRYGLIGIKLQIYKIKSSGDGQW